MDDINAILSGIPQADDQQINRILDSVRQWYRDTYPDQEVIFLSLPKNDPIRRRAILEWAMALCELGQNAPQWDI